MSVLLETSLGDMVFDLHVDMCPVACKNFVKLCQRKYYNNCIFHSGNRTSLCAVEDVLQVFTSLGAVEKDFIAQSGDPTNTGQGGECIYSLLDKTKKRGEKKFFKDEIFDHMKHKVQFLFLFPCIPSYRCGEKVDKITCCRTLEPWQW